MDINSILKTMGTMGVGLDQEKLNELKQTAASYPQNKEGLLRAINERGSMEMFNKAMQKAKSPLGKMILKKVGISEDVIDFISGEVKSGGSTEVPKPQADDILEKLRRLK